MSAKQAYKQQEQEYYKRNEHLKPVHRKNESRKGENKPADLLDIVRMKAREAAGKLA